MALLALLAGIADRVESARAAVRAQPAAASFLKLNGITGNTKSAFLKVESKYYKLQNALTKVENTLAAKVVTIASANATFLTIKDANAQFMKSDQAFGTFLTLGGTAANSNELGGLSPDAFFQGQGNVVTGAVTVTKSSQQQLLASPGGIIVVDLGVDSDGVPSLTIQNNAGNELPAVQDLGESPPPAGGTGSQSTSSQNLPTGQTTLTLSTAASQLHLQIFPAGSFDQVATLTVSVEPALNGGGFSAVGQMLNGAG
ncbi:MAG TPA: hypothetical protein VMD09_01500 [Solirubrobacteraceae bacterium]|nr:hypothetical protein [Solirubrobacteraceae bacterium]